ncbi:MAG: phosphate signaling complex protein PhoU [Ruminococcus flavefaciens]|nr:phosphate signaling complex protein PhoU [Ruminococcus flavefaciens]
MAREYYGLQLKELKNQMLLLGSMIEGVIEDTVRALVSQDIEKAKEIAAGDDKVDRLVRRIEEQCYSLLLRQQPVARDLREVSAALKMITDMERIGDHGTDISELTILMSGNPYPDEIRMIEAMSKEAMVMLIEAVDAFAQADAKKAGAVIEKDDIVDELFLKVKDSIALSVKTSETNAKQELDLLMVAKYFERIGDHATNIAEWVLFGITGELPKD